MRLRRLIEKYLKFETHFLLALLFIPLIAVFFILEKVLVPKYAMYVPIDDCIPYIPEFVVFYFIWFVYIFVFTSYFAFNSKRDFIRLIVFVTLGMALSFVIYVIFPNEQLLRPTNTGGGIFGKAVLWLHSIDTPTNVCPSIHAINSLGVHYTVKASDAEFFGKPKLVKRISFVTALLIILSTMLIKQHSIIDVACGAALAAVINLSQSAIEKKRLSSG